MKKLKKTGGLILACLILLSLVPGAAFAAVGSPPVDLPPPVERVTIVTSAFPADGGRVIPGGTLDLGASVTLWAEPNSGWTFDGWFENDTRVSSNALWTFTATADRTLQARFTQQQTDHPFTDVRPGDWFNNAVAFVFDQRVMTGTSTTTFDPLGTLTRAQVARMLWNMENQPFVNFSPIFTDVPATAPVWYRYAVVWAAENEIVQGYQGRFSPHDNITREQFAVMMYRYAEFAGHDTTVPENFNLNQFVDQGCISDWAFHYVRWAVYNGLITGTPDARISPDDTANRAEAATIIMRYVQAFGE